MKLLKAPSEAAREILRALNLPKKTVGFTLNMRTNELATLDVEMYVEAAAGEELAKVIKRYNLQAVEEPAEPGVGFSDQTVEKLIPPHRGEAKVHEMQMPDPNENVALEYHDSWLKKSTVLIAHRQMNKWIDTRTGEPLKENGRTLYAVRWWPLVAETAIAC